MRRYFIIGIDPSGLRFHAGVEETLDDAVAKIERHADDAVEEQSEMASLAKPRPDPLLAHQFTSLVIELADTNLAIPERAHLARISVGDTEATYLCPGCGEPASEDEMHDEPNYVGVHIESYSPVCSRCESPKRIGGNR